MLGVSFPIQSVTTPMQSPAKSFTGTFSRPRGPRKLDLQGKTRQLPFVDVTRKGLNDYALRNLSNGEFQSVVFVCSVSEAVFTTNLLRLIRQDRIDLAKTASHLHEPAPPDKHRESAKFMVPLLAELLHTIKGSAPPEKSGKR